MSAFNRVFLGTATCALATFAVASPAFAQQFSGPYAGVEAGVAHVKVEGATIAGPFEGADDTVVAGAVLGYRMPLDTNGMFVAGVEGNVGGYTGDAGARFAASGIAGVRLLPQGMVYGRVGYGWLNSVDLNGDRGLDGVMFGGGYEHALSDAMHVRAEYRQYDYKDRVAVDDIARFSGHEITVGLVFGF